ncbi:MAG: winged helix-turn-helix domain-containing protein [Alphaproteobacteria bacterium]
MIGIIAKNNLTRQALCDVLAEFEPVVYQSSETAPDLIVLYQSTDFADGFLKTPVPCPVLLVGAVHEEADFYLPVPCHLSALKAAVVRGLEASRSAPVFENPVFYFNGKNRFLRHKQTEAEFYLTEKENALVMYLARHIGQKCSKEELLQQVWNYHPDTETHTLESHIYALKQKIGLDANLFIQNDEGGYFLLTE